MDTITRPASRDRDRTGQDVGRPVSRHLVIAAHLVALTVLPAAVWRVVLGSGVTMGFTRAALEADDMPGWGTVSVVFLSLLTESLALLTLGLVRSWGEVVPGWVPRLAGRRIPPRAVVIPATIGGVLLTAIWGYAFAGLIGVHESAVWEEISGTGWRALMISCYVPALFWGPLLLWLTHAYARRRRASATASGEHQPTTRTRRALRAGAILACLPYLSLKTAWVLGSQAGIPAGSSLLDGGATLRIANAVGVVMDAGVIVIALLLTRPWGLRVPAWLLVGPVWLATGLLTPIMLAYPAQVVARLVGNRPPATTNTGDPFLAEWVFGVVYTGFIVQGLALGALFALYARQRWSHLWVGRLADLPRAERPQHLAAVGIAALTTFALTMHLLWACGSEVGLTDSRAAERTRDYYIVEAAFVVLASATAIGLLVWVFRLSARPAWQPLGLGIVASAGLAGWGGWLLIVTAVNTDAAKQSTSLMSLTHFAQVILGAWSLALAVGFSKERRRARALRMHPAGGSCVCRRVPV